MKMFFIMLTAQNSLDYAPQLIGVLGTLMGTILGWLLHLLSNNSGKIHISLDDYRDQKSNNEYAYIAKIFIYNASHKQQCLRNIRFSFTRYSWKILFESVPAEGKCSFETVRTKRENKVGMISINSDAQCEFIFSCLIDGASYDKLSKVRKVYLVYEDKKNNTKKKLIKADFKIASVEKSKSERFL